MNALARHDVPRTALALILGLLAVVLLGPPAHAADDTSSWAVQPADAKGKLDGRTKFELQLKPGETAKDMVRISNASIVQRTFRIYATDAFNTKAGGFDLLPAADKPTDVGAWTTVAFKQFTIPALSVVAIPITVTVPKDATPGDHSGGIVASVVTPGTTAAGSSVTVDNRVATRLYIRVAGRIAPKLEVRNVRASYDHSLVPFGQGTAVVSYDVVNSGNVRIKGDPTLRIGAPFGAVVARAHPAKIPEVLPGHSYTVTIRVGGVLPLGPLTATVDLRQTPSDGPAATIPLVTSSARGSFLAISLTGLLALAIVGYGLWTFLRRRRTMRRAGEHAWGEMVEAARREAASEAHPQESRMVVVLLAVLGLGLFFGAAAPGDDGSGSISLVVPGATASPSPSEGGHPAPHPSGTPSATPTRGGPAPHPTSTEGGPHHGALNPPHLRPHGWGVPAGIVTSFGGGLLLFILGAYNRDQMQQWGAALGGWMQGWRR